MPAPKLTTIMNPWDQNPPTQVLPNPQANPELLNTKRKLAVAKDNNELVDRLLSIALMDLSAGDINSAQEGILEAQRIVVDALR